MHLTENDFEKKLMQDLPPNARDVAEEMLSRYSLAELLDIQSSPIPSTALIALLADHRTSKTFWQAIVQATLLAKVTYFLPNKEMSQSQILYLIKTACINAGYPLAAYTLVDIIEITKGEMPTLSSWLKQMAGLLMDKKNA